MITEQEYLKAVSIVKEYHNQIDDIIHEVPELKVRNCKKVKCIKTYAGRHDLYFLTLGKEYDIIHMPCRNYFRIVDDNGKLRYYQYKNPNQVWEFLNTP